MRLTPVLILLLGLLAGPLPSQAAESPAIRSARATATVVADRQAVAPGEAFTVGLRLRLAPGWHTYWRNPGDAGAPPEVTLDLPDGATAGPIAWPAPQRIPTGPLVSFGYEHEEPPPMPVPPRRPWRPTAAWRSRPTANWPGWARSLHPRGRPVPADPAGRPHG